MASTYSSNLRLELMADGEKNNTWGQITNTNLGTLLEQSICGYEAINAAGSSDVTLTSNNGSSDQARKAFLKFTGTLTGNINVIIPAVSKEYLIWNATSGSFTLTVKVSGQTGVAVTQGEKAHLACDGTVTYDAISDRAKIGKQTIWVPADAMRATFTSGCSDTELAQITSGKPNRVVRWFDPTNAEYAQFSIAMPKSWNLGTVTFIPYWTTTATDTTGVAWTMDAVAISDNEAIDGSYGTAIAVIDNCQSNANRVMIGAESSAVTIAGTPAAGDLVFYRIGRDPTNGSDTMAVDAGLIGLKLLYTTNAGNDV